jgi:hypothetical protein
MLDCVDDEFLTKRTWSGWSIRALAAAAQVAPSTITRLGPAETLGTRTLAAIRTALEAAGVDLIAESGGGPGVRLKKASEQPRANDRALKSHRDPAMLVGHGPFKRQNVTR